ncbi:hypothetical protein ACLHDG_04995 [Sulfurovum sp. CS9]|uniref:tetratricopeptide repeat protein n=1 Tax=Sulfurovum sp. CS9 TaxID=3391146 RepID=UPI0039E8A4A0
MYNMRYKYFYMLGILLVFLGSSYAENSVKHYNIPVSINTLIEGGKQKDAIILINQIIEEKKSNLSKTKKIDTMQFASLYDEIAELMILKNQLLSDIKKIYDIDTDQICNFILDYEEVEFIKTQYYKTPFHDDVAKTLTNITKLYEYCHPPLAEKYLKSILKIKENVYGENSEDVAQSLDDLAYFSRVHTFIFDDAIKQYQKAKAIRKAIYTKDDSKVTKNYARLAIVIFYHKSDKVKAEQLILESLNIRKSDKNANSIFIYQALIDTAYFYDLTGNYKKSLKYLKEAEKLLQELGKENSPEMVEVYKSISTLYLNMDDEKASHLYLKKALSVKVR